MRNHRTSLTIDCANPINWSHPLNRGRAAWWLTVPGLMGGARWHDLCSLPGDFTRGRHGTLANGPSWQGTSRTGGWGHLLCDGSDDCVTTPLTIPRGPFSVAAWVRLTSAGSYPMFVTGVADADLRCNSSSRVPQFGNGAATAPALTLGTWYRLLGVADGASGVGSGSLFFYLNGSLLTTDTLTWSVSNAVLIGKRADGFNLPGAIDDVAIWTRALSSDEASSDYRLSSRGYPGALNRVGPPVFRSAAAPTVLNVPLALLHLIAVAPTRGAGGVARAVPTASLALAAVAPTRTVGGVSRSVPTAIVHLAAPYPSVAPGPVSRSVPLASLHLVSVFPTAVPGAVARAVPSAAFTLTAPAPTAIPGAVMRTVPLATFSLTATAPGWGATVTVFVTNYGETAYPELDWTITTEYPPR